MEVDLLEVGRERPLIGVLGALRALPDIVSHLLHGEAAPQAPARLRLRDTATLPADKGGWILLGERPREEIALGLVGKFWRPVIAFATVSRDGFRDFAEPGYAKTVYSLSVHALDEHRTLLPGTMRTATTDDQARVWFRRHWTLGVGSGAHILVNGVLDVTRELSLMVPALTIGGILLSRRRPWGYLIASIASIQGALYLLVLSVNSVVAIRRGLASAPGELPIWGTLALLTTMIALVLLVNAERGRAAVR